MTTQKSRKTPAINILAIILACLEMGLFSGTIFGWSSLVYVYKDVGYFADMCDVTGNSWNLSESTTDATSKDPTPLIGNTSVASTVVSTTSTTLTTVTSRTSDVDARVSDLSCQEQIDVRSRDEGASRICDSQDEQFNLIFSISTGVSGILCFPNGLMYDRMGTRFTRIVSLITYCVGALLLIFASPSMSYLLYPGVICLTYGAYLLQGIDLPLAALVPRYRSTIMSIIAGSFDSSSVIFVLFKIAHEAGFSVNASFIVQTVMFFILVTSSTFFLFPTHWLANPLPDGFRLRCRLCGVFRRNKKYSTGGDGEPSKAVSTGMSVVSIRSLTGSTEADSRRNNTGQPFDMRNTDTLGSTNGEMFERRNKQGTCNTDLVYEVGFGTIVEEDNGHLYNGRADKVPSSKGSSLFKEQTHDEESFDALSSNTVLSKEHTFNGLSSKEHAASGLSSKENELSLKDESVSSAEPSPLDEKTVSAEKMTFRQVISSLLFWTHLVWFSLHRFRSLIFVGVFNPWIARLACGDKSAVSHYTSVYAYMQFTGVFLAPWSGRLMDRKIKGAAEKYGHPRFERIHASITNFALDTTVGVLLTVGTLIPVMQAQYVTFVMHVVHRSILYGTNAAFVATAFPLEHFGKVYGTTLTVAAIVGFLQYPCFLIVYGPLDGNPFWVTIGVLILIVITYIHPIYIWRYLQQTAKQLNGLPKLTKEKLHNGHNSMNL